MKTKEEKLEDLLGSRSYEVLSQDEKQFVLDLLGSAEEFRKLQQIQAKLQGSALNTSVEPAPEVLSSLKRKFREKQRETSIFQSILLFKMPAYATLLVSAFVAFAVVLILKPSPQPLMQAEVRTVQVDTVYITKTDTVYRDRLQIKYRRVPLPAEPRLASAKSEKTMGVSMKDKEELDKLLVSGLN